MLLKKEKNCVVISRAEELDFSKDYAALPKNYGAPEYYDRADIKAILKTVRENLEILDRRTGFTRELKDRSVLIKPNLVIVYHRAGFVDKEYPESTDPRVLDAVVHFVKKYTDDIIIVESSGRGLPTRAAFKIAGLDRLARHHRIGLTALEEVPVQRYILPKAKVMKEILVPEIFVPVVAGEAFYISVPKMKTNLYTDVTLGLKNAMGVLPYNLRQRSHHYDLEQKLVDMLYLFKPGLVVIDGIVGAEGNCPAPVFPVDSRVIISGTDCVETDRAAARFMGFDPDQVKLLRAAGEMGFADPGVEIVGQEEPLSFRKADPSLFSDEFDRLCPNVRVLVGHELKDSPPVSTLDEVDAVLMKKMEMSCRGGCLATVRFALDMIRYEGHDMDFPLTIIIGTGVTLPGQADTTEGAAAKLNKSLGVQGVPTGVGAAHRTFQKSPPLIGWVRRTPPPHARGAAGGKNKIWFDRLGKPYSKEDIASLESPKLAVGSCTAELAPLVDKYLAGCMPFPGAPHTAIHELAGLRCMIKSLKNKQLLTLFFATLRMRRERRRQIKKGLRFDCEFGIEDRIVEPRPLTPGEQEKDFVSWEFPPLSKSERKRILRAERRETLDTFK